MNSSIVETSTNKKRRAKICLFRGTYSIARGASMLVRAEDPKNTDMMLYIATVAFFLINSVSAAQLRWQPNDQQAVLKLASYSIDESPSFEDFGTTSSGARVAIGEQVDRQALPSGDIFWHTAPATAQVDRYLQAFVNRLPVDSVYSGQAPLHKRRVYDNEWSLSGDNQARDYDTLVNEFKHWSHLSGNPMRENRAFKPKLMSTARGFGKRSPAIGGSDLTRASVGGLFAGDSSSTGPDGKMSGSAIR